MNEDRRKFLKIVLIGSASLIVGKILGPLFSGSLNDPLAKKDPPKPVQKDSSSPFRVVEDGSSLSIYDNSGEEVFQIDKG